MLKQKKYIRENLAGNHGTQRTVTNRFSGMPFSASDGEKVAKPDEVSAGEWCRGLSGRSWAKTDEVLRRPTFCLSTLRSRTTAEDGLSSAFWLLASPIQRTPDANAGFRHNVRVDL
jgi:hypothetical protein